MDILSLPTQILLLLAAFIFYYFSRSSKKTNETTPPEPRGSWPLIGHLHLLGGQAPLCRTLGAMADEHGPIFSLRLGRERGVVVSSWEMMKECFTTNDRIFASRPVMAIGKYLGYDNACFGLTTYGPYWRDVRKMVTVDMFTARRLDDLSHVRAEELDGFVKDLYEKSGGGGGGGGVRTVVGLSGRIEHLTFNIITRTLAGKRFPYSNGDGKDLEFKEAIKQALYLGGVFVFSDVIPSLEWLDIGGHIKGMKHTFKEVDKIFGDWIQERIQAKRQNNDKIESDFLDVMLSTIQENEIVGGYNREIVIKSTLLILMMTGSESTSVTLIWTLSLLMNNPHTLKLAQEEIENIVGRDRWVQESDINNLNYLQSVFKETLRLYPPGPLSGPREALEDCHIGKYYIPKGTRMTANLWKLHRDPNVWSDPDEFRPERFLNENSQIHFKGQCFEFIPFSSGRRMCPGMGFGLRVVQLALARLLQAFELSTPNGEAVDMEEGLGIALPKMKSLDVVLTPRLPRELYENL